MNELEQKLRMAEESEQPTRLSFEKFVNIGLRLLHSPTTIPEANRLDYRLVLEALRDGKKIIFSYVADLNGD